MLELKYRLSYKLNDVILCYYFIAKVEIFEDQSLNLIKDKKPRANNSLPGGSLLLQNQYWIKNLDLKIQLNERINQTLHEL